MKKILAMLLAVSMAFSLAACGGSAPAAGSAETETKAPENSEKGDIADKDFEKFYGEWQEAFGGPRKAVLSPDTITFAGVTYAISEKTSVDDSYYCIYTEEYEKDKLYFISIDTVLNENNDSYYAMWIYDAVMENGECVPGDIAIQIYSLGDKTVYDNANYQEAPETWPQYPLFSTLEPQVPYTIEGYSYEVDTYSHTISFILEFQSTEDRDSYKAMLDQRGFDVTQYDTFCDYDDPETYSFFTLYDDTPTSYWFSGVFYDSTLGENSSGGDGSIAIAESSDTPMIVPSQIYPYQDGSETNIEFYEVGMVFGFPEYHIITNDAFFGERALYYFLAANMGGYIIDRIVMISPAGTVDYNLIENVDTLTDAATGEVTSNPKDAQWYQDVLASGNIETDAAAKEFVKSVIADYSDGIDWVEYGLEEFEEMANR